MTLFNPIKYDISRQKEMTLWEIEQATNSQPDNVSFASLSRRLANIQSLSKEPLRIIGSSALRVLEYSQGKSFFPGRDFDCAVVVCKNINSHEVNTLRQKIINRTNEIVVNLIPTVRDRIPEGFPLGNHTMFVSGYGFYLQENHKDTIIDLSFFDHSEDLAMNGLLARDQVQIILKDNSSLEEFYKYASVTSLDQLKKEQWVVDPNDFFSKNEVQNEQIIHWCEIEKKPLSSVMRLIRSLGKTNKLPLDTSKSGHDWKNIHQFITSACRWDVNKISLLFSRILTDKHAPLELTALHQLGIFNKWATPFSKILDQLNLEELSEIVNLGKTETPLAILMHLSGGLSKSDQLTLFWEVIAPVSYKLFIKKAIEILSTILPELGACDLRAIDPLLSIPKSQNVNKRFTQKMKWVIKSSTLTLEEKFTLIIREIAIYCSPISFKDTLTQIFPNCDSFFLTNFENNIKKSRTGLFTGVFDPITIAHTKICKIAIKQMILDDIYLIPVILTNQGRTPSKWKTRQEMIELAILNIPEAKTCPLNMKPFIKKGIENTFNELRSRLKFSPTFIQVQGSDAYNRFKNYGFLKKPNSDINRILVIHRLFQNKISIPKGKERLVSFFQPEIPTGLIGDQAISSTLIRRKVEAGCSISTFVCDKVDEYIRSKMLYKPPFPFNTSFQLICDPQYIDIVKNQLITVTPSSFKAEAYSSLSARDAVIAKIDACSKTGRKQVIAIETRYSDPKTNLTISPRDIGKNTFKFLRIEVVVGYFWEKGHDPEFFECTRTAPLERLEKGEELVADVIRQLVHHLLRH
ncbi:MAG: hypothetical protein VX777_05580 [Chlamydiota bacterium]|nr:hypothetical protein [Chlamydiota bacterium]